MADLQSVAVVRVENRQFLIPAGLLKQHCPTLHSTLSDNVPLIRVKIEGVRSQTFKLIESYIRIGQLPEVTVNNVVDLYAAAINLGMQRLATRCYERIYGSSVEDQALIYYVECMRNHNTEETASALQYLAKSFKMIALSRGITELSEDQLIKILDSEPVRQRPQSERFIAALRWLHADCKQRRDRSKNLLSRFDFSDDALAGFEVCPEVMKKVPALRAIARATIVQKIASSDQGEARSTSTTDRQSATVGTVTGGASAVSPPEEAAWKTHDKKQKKGRARRFLDARAKKDQKAEKAKKAEVSPKGSKKAKGSPKATDAKEAWATPKTGSKKAKGSPKVIDTEEAQVSPKAGSKKAKGSPNAANVKNTEVSPKVGSKKAKGSPNAANVKNTEVSPKAGSKKAKGSPSPADNKTSGSENALVNTKKGSPSPKVGKAKNVDVLTGENKPLAKADSSKAKESPVHKASEKKPASGRRLQNRLGVAKNSPVTVLGETTKAGNKYSPIPNAVKNTNADPNKLGTARPGGPSPVRGPSLVDAHGAKKVFSPLKQYQAAPPAFLQEYLRQKHPVDTNRPMEDLKTSKSLEKVEQPHKPGNPPRSSQDPRLNEQYSILRITKLAEERTNMLRKQKERPICQCSHDETTATFSRSAKADDSSTDSTTQDIKAAPVRKKRFFLWPKMRHAQKEKKLKKKNRSQRLWANLKKEAKVLAGGRRRK